VNIAILPGDGIGPEIVTEAVRVLEALELSFNTESALVGGAAYEAHGHPLPAATLKLAQDADAVLFGALARNPTTSLTFGAGSLTTVGGGATPIPYGTTLDLKEYFFTPYSLAPLTITPVGQLALRGASIDVQAGAKIDLKGGGDVFAETGIVWAGTGEADVRR
jgi:hypothetical protein